MGRSLLLRVEFSTVGDDVTDDDVVDYVNFLADDTTHLVSSDVLLDRISVERCVLVKEARHE
jgi:hypothetical protein